MNFDTYSQLLGHYQLDCLDISKQEVKHISPVPGLGHQTQMQIVPLDVEQFTYKVTFSGFEDKVGLIQTEAEGRWVNGLLRIEFEEKPLEGTTTGSRKYFDCSVAHCKPASNQVILMFVPENGKAHILRLSNSLPQK